MFNFKDILRNKNEPKNNWDEELIRIDDEYKQDHQVYKKHIVTFNTFVSNLRSQLEVVIPNLKVYHKRHRIGNIHYHPPGTAPKPYTLNIYITVDITEKLAKVVKEPGRVTLISKEIGPWTNLQKKYDQEKFYYAIENILIRTSTQLRLEPRMAEAFKVTRTGRNMDMYIQQNDKEGFLIKIIPALVYAPRDTLDKCFAVVDRNYFTKKKKILATSWRLIYPTREERILKDEPILRMCIRFMKLMRNSYEMPYLPNYVIKMLFLTLTGGYGIADFFRQNLTSILKQIVTLLEQKMAARKVMDPWDYQYNILNDYYIAEVQYEDCINKLKAIKRRLDDKNDNIEKILFNIPLKDEIVSNKPTFGKEKTTNAENEFIMKAFGSDGTKALKSEDNFTTVFVDENKAHRSSIFEGLYKYPEFSKSSSTYDLTEKEEMDSDKKIGCFAVNKLFHTTHRSSNMNARQYVSHTFERNRKNNESVYVGNGSYTSLASPNMQFKSLTNLYNTGGQGSSSFTSQTEVPLALPRFCQTSNRDSFGFIAGSPFMMQNPLYGSLTGSLFGMNQN